jgi:glycosyltransferase involved in cell wall biosynthesis
MNETIIILTRSLPQHGIGGMEVVAWELATGLAKFGYEVIVITTSLHGKKKKTMDSGVNIIYLDNVRSGKYTSEWWTESKKEFIKLACEKNIKMVFSISAGAYGLLSLKNKYPSTTFVMQAHGTSLGEIISKLKSKRIKSIFGAIKNLLWLPRDLKMYRSFDYIISVGSKVDRQLKNTPFAFFFDKNKIIRIDNGIDDSFFKPSTANRTEVRKHYNIKSDSPIIITVCRLHKQKGVIESLEGFVKFKIFHPDARYIIVGEGDERGIIEKKYSRLIATKDVILTGALTRECICQLLQAADVFMFLSMRTEVGMTLNLLEAAGVGLPAVVSFNIPNDGQSQIYHVDPNEPDNICIALESAFSKSKKSSEPYIDDDNKFSIALNKYLGLIEK